MTEEPKKIQETGNTIIAVATDELETQERDKDFSLKSPPRDEDMPNIKACLAEDAIKLGNKNKETISTITVVDETNIERLFEKGLNKILTAFEAKLAYDKTKQTQIDRLHEELQQHRGDLLARTIRPLAHGMIRLHDDIGKLLSTLRMKSADELTPDRFFSLLEGLQEDVEIVLGQNGIAAYREPLGPFDPRRQRLIRRVGTSEERLTDMVAESIRPGFEQGTEILEKERVATYEFSRPPGISTQGEAPGLTQDEDVAAPEYQMKER